MERCRLKQFQFLFFKLMEIELVRGIMLLLWSQDALGAPFFLSFFLWGGGVVSDCNAQTLHKSHEIVWIEGNPMGRSPFLGIRRVVFNALVKWGFEYLYLVFFNLVGNNV